MTTPTYALELPHRPLRWIRHSLVLARRSLAKTSRNPGAIVNGVVTPALFLVLFLYLFGNAVAGATDDYLQYLFPGILVMGAGLTGLVSTGTSINIDLKNGVTDRFRSLPISRLAPLLGSVLADIVRYLAAVAILFLIGTALGFRGQRASGSRHERLLGAGIDVLSTTSTSEAGGKLRRSAWHAHGMSKIVWWEIETPEPEAFQRFHGAMWGWGFEPAFANTELDADYWLIKVGDESIGGLQRSANDTRPHAGTRLYVEVADLEHVLRQVQALGGQVERPRTELGGNDRWFATALDPAGVSFGMWTAFPAAEPAASRAS